VKNISATNWAPSFFALLEPRNMSVDLEHAGVAAAATDGQKKV